VVGRTVVPHRSGSGVLLPAVLFAVVRPDVAAGFGRNQSYSVDNTAKALQYSALLILGKTGVQKLKKRFRRNQ